jgi:hypothetical protein
MADLYTPNRLRVTNTISTVSETLEEEKKVLEAGYGYVTDVDNRRLFRRRK